MRLPAVGAVVAAFACVCVMYIDRAVISNAIIPISAEMQMTDAMRGWLLSAFAWGYVAGMIPGGMLGVRYSPRLVVGGVSLVWALAMALTAAASSFPQLLLARVLLGLAEAPVFPCLARLIAERVPKTHRTKATAIFDSGSYLGPLVGGPVFVFMSFGLGWRGALQVLAVATVSFALLWLSTLRDVRTRDTRSPSVSLSTMWTICRDGRVQAASAGFFAYNFVKSLFFTWLPVIVAIDWQQTESVAAGVTSACFGVGLIGLAVSSALLDRIASLAAKPLAARAAGAAIGLALGGLLALVPFTPSMAMKVALLLVAAAGVISCSGTIWTIPAELTHRSTMVPAIGAVQNCFANVANILAPLVVGWLREGTPRTEWSFVIFGLTSVGGAVAFGVLRRPSPHPGLAAP